MKRLLVIGYVWPEPNSSAAGSRMMQLLHLFLKENYTITYATTAAASDHAVNLKDLGIHTQPIVLNNSSFDEFITDLNPDTVLFDRFMMEEQYGWRVDQACPEAIKILDTEDLHFLRNARTLAFKQGVSQESLYMDSDLAKREIASIFRCDISIMISEFEMELLQRDFNIPRQLLHYLPFLIDPIFETEINTLPDFDETAHFISIGNFRHEPNWNAVLYLKQEIWPIIRKALPKAELHVYGAYPSKKVTDLNNTKDGFIIKGWADSAAEVLKKARVLLAPIRFGAGLKGKLTDAMQYGTPSVTTSVGAEGINGDLQWSGKIAETTEAFAKAAIQLYTEKNSWEKSRNQGFEILRKRFDKTLFEDDFVARINSISAALKQHRSENFIGSMLKHHQHRSTYFMAKYIEEKNKKSQV